MKARILFVTLLLLSGACAREIVPPSKPDNGTKGEDAPPVSAEPTKAPPVTGSAGEDFDTLTQPSEQAETAVSSPGHTVETEQPAEGAVTSASPPEQTIQPAQTIQTAQAEPAVEATVSTNFCAFPKSVQQAVMGDIQKPCAEVEPEELKKIKTLKLQNLKLSEADLLTEEHARLLASLENLDLSNSPELTAIPQFVYFLSNLKSLNISQTGITDFDPDMCRLQKLNILKASHNNYKGREVPMPVFCLSALTTLDMSYSRLRYIDEYIYKLENLEELYMAGNNLMAVPFMLQLMNSLLLVDLTGNDFTFQGAFSTIFGYDLPPLLGYPPLNTLHTCKDQQEEDISSCQEDMLYNFKCEWWYQLPFERGTPFRRYKEMTDEEWAAFSAEGRLPGKDRCYLWWLNSFYIPLSEEEKTAYDEHTINGKTRREWRVVFTAMKEHWGGNTYGLIHSFSYCNQRILYSNTYYGPSDHEIWPERFYSGEWNEFPVECEQDRHLYEDVEHKERL